MGRKKKIALALMATAIVALATYVMTDEALLGYLSGTIFLYLKTFLTASKKKLFLFLKTLTVTKAFMIGVKRFIIDNYVSKWIEKNVIEPVKDSAIKFTAALFKTGRTKILMAIASSATLLYLAYVFDVLHQVLFFAEIKAFVIGFFKFLWIVGDKIFAFFYNLFVNSFMAPILQIFALSYILEKMEKIPYIGRYIKKTFDALSSLFSTAFKKIEKILTTNLSRKTRTAMRKLAKKIEAAAEKMRSSSEIFLMSKFIEKYGENPYKYIQKDIHKYLKKIKKDRIENIEEKKEFLKWHNLHTDDDIHFKGIFNIGEAWPPVKDVLAMESIASDNEKGNVFGKIGKNDMWIVNLAPEALILHMRGGRRKKLKPGKIYLVKDSGAIDAYIVKNGKRVYRTPI